MTLHSNPRRLLHLLVSVAVIASTAVACSNNAKQATPTATTTTDGASATEESAPTEELAATETPVDSPTADTAATPEPTVAPEFNSVCILTTHLPEIGDFPSFLTFVLELFGIPAGSTITLRMDGVNDGSPFVATIGENGSISADAGIRQYGPYSGLQVTVADPDGNVIIDVTLADTYEVDATEGADSEMCFP